MKIRCLKPKLSQLLWDLEDWGLARRGTIIYLSPSEQILPLAWGTLTTKGPRNLHDKLRRGCVHSEPLLRTVSSLHTQREKKLPRHLKDNILFLHIKKWG